MMIPDSALMGDDAFESWLRKQPREEVALLQSRIDAVNDAYMRQFEGMRRLFHGAPSAVAQQIRDGGFRLGPGRRSGAFGSEKTVQNQAIFLTDSKHLAHAYGSNRADHPGDVDVLEVYADVPVLLDMRTWSQVPKSIRSYALQRIAEYGGHKGRKPKQDDWFWLIDQPDVVAKIREEGYDGVVFEESTATKKALGADEGATIAVFDPQRLHIPRQPLRNLSDYREYFREEQRDVVMGKLKSKLLR